MPVLILNMNSTVNKKEAIYENFHSNWNKSICHVQ